MRLPFETIFRDSSFNGKIHAFKKFGQWRVDAGGTQQSGPEMNDIWLQALARAKPHSSAGEGPHILMLGLGSGGGLVPIYSLFPQCRVVAVEHDPAMVALSQELKLYAPFPEPVVLTSDAQAAVSSLCDTFDYILVDLFNGAEVSPVVVDKDFLVSLDKLLSPGGALLVNAFVTPEIFEPMEEVFLPVEYWQYKDNWLGFFQKSGR